MRFSVVAAAIMATAVSAGSTVYVTEEVTITSCAPTVTNCPAHSTVVSTHVTSYIHTTTPSYVNSTVPTPIYTPVYTPPASVSTYAPVVTKPVSLSTITISTCVPTVIYSTITVSPSATPVYTPPTNATAPQPTGTKAPYPPPSGPAFTGAASTIKGSVSVAILGLAAFLLA